MQLLAPLVKVAVTTIGAFVAAEFVLKLLAREEGSVENPNAAEIESPDAQSMRDSVF